MPRPSLLPAGFDDLEPFVSSWGHLHTSEDRYLKRQDSSFDELNAFYRAMVPRIRAVLSHLDGFSVDEELPEKEATLSRIALGFGEAAAGIEVHGQPRIPFVEAPHRVRTEWNDGETGSTIDLPEGVGEA